MWAVPDLATAMLMTEFYQRWQPGMTSPARALRDAQQWIRDTTNAVKVTRYEAALDSPQGGIPKSVATAFIDQLVFREPDERSEAVTSAWAGFAHVGA